MLFTARLYWLQFISDIITTSLWIRQFQKLLCLSYQRTLYNFLFVISCAQNFSRIPYDLSMSNISFFLIFEHVTNVPVVYFSSNLISFDTNSHLILYLFVYNLTAYNMDLNTMRNLAYFVKIIVCKYLQGSCVASMVLEWQCVGVPRPSLASWCLLS